MRAEAAEFIPQWKPLSVSTQCQKHSPLGTPPRQEDLYSEEVERNNNNIRHRKGAKAKDEKLDGENRSITCRKKGRRRRHKMQPAKNQTTLTAGCNDRRHNFSRQKVISSKEQKDTLLSENSNNMKRHETKSRRRRKKEASLQNSCMQEECISLPKMDKKYVVIDAESFPSLSQPNHIDPVIEDRVNNAKNRWSLIANEGHTKSVQRDIEHIQDCDRLQKEIDTYTRMETLGGESHKLIDFDDRSTPDPKQSDSEDLMTTTCTCTSNVLKNSSGTGKLLNVDKLKEKWSLVIEQWSITKKKQEELCETRERREQIKAARIESESSCTSFHQNSEEEEGDELSPHDTNIRQSYCVFESCSLYLDLKYPLHIALSNDDKDAVKALITLSPERTLRDERITLVELQNVVECPLQIPQKLLNTRFSLLQLAVVLDKSYLLQFLLSSASSSNLNMVTSTFAVDDLDGQKRTPLMLACELGFNDCIRGLLRFGPKVTLRQQRSGDSALHMACRFGGPSTVLAMLITLRGKDDKFIANKDKNSARQRLICCRNRKNETSLHIACKRGRFDILEALLSSCSSATADKALVAEDCDGHTPLLSAIVNGAIDIVMHLLTWRGNHRGNVSLAKDCPLILAVGTKSMEMFQLLIECRSQSVFESYDYTGALLKAIWCFEEREPEVHSFIQILIEEGADPHKKVNFSHSLIHDEKGHCILGKSPLTLAAMQGRVHFVTKMLDTYSMIRQRQINAMQGDPYLRSQSSEYFLSIEAKEREKIKDSCEDTLIKLLIASCDDSELSTWRLGCCLVLLRRNTLIDDNAFLRLFEGMSVGHPERILSSAHTLAPNMAEFEGRYRCTSRTSMSVHSHYCRPVLKDWSESLLLLDWMRLDLSRDIVSCSWIKKALKTTRGDEERSNIHANDEESELCTFVVEGRRLVAHKIIFTQKSAKLEAAIRFEEMKRNSEMDNSGSVPEIILDISVRYFCFIVQHCYHGSICCGLSSDLTECCQELLDLYILSMEYLCPSLALECEMRLLSSNPYNCFCWNCCDRAETISESARGNELSCHYKVKVCYVD